MEDDDKFEKSLDFAYRKDMHHNISNHNTADYSINIKDFESHYFNVMMYFKNKKTYASCIDFGKQYYVDSVELCEYEIFTLDKFKNLDDIKENYNILEKTIINPYDKYRYDNKYLFLIEEEIKENIFIRYKESINSDYVIEYFKEYHDKSDRMYIELLKEHKQDIEIEKDNLAEFFKYKAQVYEVLSNETDKELEIIHSDAERNVLCISANEKPSKICVKYNISQLKNYIKGIQNITEKTKKIKKESFTIFDIFKLIRGKNVIIPYQIENIKWEILKDDTRKGCKEQRDFVIKALNTEDICVLEGPPGSGKTTCISELILQILKNNPRAKILLMASTHVAVDNVLERLVDYNLPAVRLGVEDRIADNMKAYKYPEVIDTEYDKFMQYHKNKDIEKYFNSKNGKAEFERLIKYTTNIVCCTTNGIHKYINIKEQDEIITTNFDYLILDEASKTTIAEFLAVARYAKKWILTGDIKQLSPYTDADELSVSIKKYIVYNIGTFIDRDKYKSDKFEKFIEERIYPILSKVFLCSIKDFDKEDLIHIPIPDDLDRDICIKFCDYINKNINSNALIYYEYKNYDEREKAVLENFADIVISTDNFYKKNRKNFYKDPYNKIKYRIWNKHLDKKSSNTKEKKDIADEITWRLIRDYELRQLKDNEQLKNKYVDKYISEAEKLIPKNIQNKIKARRNVVTQSILELTQNTLYGMGNKFQSLTYQHRMPDNLAELPRNIIYHGNNMLSNDENSYLDNTKWYHIVSNKAVTRNDDECKCILDDIKDIISSKPNKKVEIAILTFYRAQERLIQKALKSEYGKKNYIEKNNVCIRVATVDRFQGQEADIVMISLSRNNGSGFLNSPNRINVAITRARKKRYIYGNHDFFLENKNNSLEIMQAVAKWYDDKKFVEIRLDKKGDK